MRSAARLVILATVLVPVAEAHEIPTDVTVRAFLKPEGTRLRLLVRVPLAAMRDMSVPTDPLGYLDLSRADAVLRDASILWIADYIELFEGERRLESPELVAARVSMPSDPSFGRFEDALAHVLGPKLPEHTELYWAQGLLDVLFEYPIESQESRFSIHPGLDRLGMRVINVLRFISPDGEVHAFDFPGDPGLIRLDPKWYHVALRFVELGFFHILEGLDHLLFLFCLVIPFRRLRSLVVIVTSFTIAHSITLMVSAFGYAPDALWFPPAIETLIALSILYMAFENIAGATLRRRWLITFGFGLVHGFGFSFLLRETLQFAGSHLTMSLLAFNLGVEIGQLLVLALVVPALDFLFRFVVAERLGTIYLSALITHSAWHWMTERLDRLGQFDWPQLDAALLVTAIRWLMVLVGLAGAAWLVSAFRQPAKPTPGDDASVGAEE
ncbi:MAG TPA: HupE/UreJ family protein [Vicinamibacteria bacterium]|nr:HupE/UreJ family protein [Vicinamibacteria bacterium]